MTTDYHLHQAFGYRISRLARLIERRFEEHLAAFDLTRLNWCILSALGHEHLIRPSDIADYIGVARPVISRSLRALEQAGLVERSTAKTDKREVRVQLTDKGRACLDQITPLAFEVADHFSCKLAPDDLARFETALVQLSDDEADPLTMI